MRPPAKPVRRVARYIRRLFFPAALVGADSALVLEVLRLGLTYAATLLFARLAGPAHFGTYVVVLAWVTLLGTLSSLGLSAGSIRFVPQYLRQGRIDYLRGFIRRARQITLVSGVGMALAAMPLATSGQSSRNASLISVGLLVTPLMGMLLLQSDIIRGWSSVPLSKIAPAIVQPTVAITAVGALAILRVPIDGRALIAALLVSVAVSWGLEEVIQARAASSLIGRGTTVFRTKEWIMVGMPLIMSKAFQLIISQSDIILVGYFLGAAEAGVYAVASKLAGLVGIFLSSVNTAAGPIVARAYIDGDRASLEMLMRQGARAAFVAAVPLALLLAGGSRIALSLFGEAFIHGATALSVLLLGRVVHAATGPVGTALNVTGSERAGAYAYGAAGVVNMVLNVFLIPRLGMVGAAIGAAIALALWNVLAYATVMSRLGIRLWPLRPRYDQ